MLTRIQRSKESGYSLVELLVAMVLLSIGFLAMGNMFVASIEHSKQGRHDMIALNSASEILERIRAVPFDDVYSLFNGVDTSDSTTVPSEARNWASHVKKQLGPTGKVVIHVYKKGDKPDLSSIGLMEVEILTSWTERARERTVRTSTYLVRMGA